ncbi:MAG: polysaccharide biosynthesis protein [Eubacteriales bacterium]
MNKRLLQLYLIDISIVLFCYASVFFYAYMTDTVVFSSVGVTVALAVMFAIEHCSVFSCFRINSTIWRYANATDYLRLFIVSLLSGAIFSAIVIISRAIELKLVYHIFACVLAATGTLCSRVVYKIIADLRNEKEHSKTENTSGRRLLIVGAGVVGSTMILDIKNNPHCGLIPVGLIDSNKEKMGRTINGVPVLGENEDIPHVCESENVDLIYIAIPSATNAKRASIIAECEKTGCEVKILPFFSEIDSSTENNLLNLVRDITPEELLGRDSIQVADENIYNFVSGKIIAVTGGGGSIGSEICRQIAAHDPKRLVIIDIYENNAYAIQQELRQKYGDSLNMEVYIASVRDFKKIDYLFSVEKPQIVFHAAAHKHVPLMEVSADEAIKNNVFGTYNTALAANNNGVDRFVLISTDKAVNPTNIMGASKRVCEMVIQYFDHISEHTSYAAVRFGNVLGSNGSVIPLFKEQIKNRQDLTVTDPRIIRYFMTIPEASQLVLTAGAMAKGGEIFVLDMGEPVKIDDLARKMIRLSGLTIGKDINIRYVGLRPGEKLYEELLVSEEGLKKTYNKKIFVSSIAPVDFGFMAQQLDQLRGLVDRPGCSSADVEHALMRLVPTFKRYIPPSEKLNDVGEKPEKMKVNAI